MSRLDAVPWSRRALLRAVALSGLCAATRPLQAASRALQETSRKLVVLTSYPDEVMARFEAAFARRFPEFPLQFIWRMPNDALPYLLDQGGVDVYWAASPRTFAGLKAAGALRKLPAFAALPSAIGNTRLRDEAGYFQATEMAAYGFALNRAALTQLGVDAPHDWRDLANPRLAGRIALPDPTRVGFAPVLVDIVLQAYGWESGWALWNEIAGLSQLQQRGAGFISDEVGSGRCAIGLSIDFFVASAIANGAPLDFVHPTRNGINPGHVAILRNADNVAGAGAFVDFLLGADGQSLLTHADIRKLPVLPAAYAPLDASYYRPFEAAARGELDYDNDAGRDRLGLVTALFGQHLVHRHDEQAVLWRRLHALEAAGRNTAALRRDFCAVPLGVAESERGETRALFRDRLEGDAEAVGNLERRWREATDRRIEALQRQLDDAM